MDETAAALLPVESQKVSVQLQRKRSSLGAPASCQEGDGLFDLQAPWDLMFPIDREPHTCRAYPCYGNAGPLADCDIALLPAFGGILRLRQDCDAMIWSSARAMVFVLERWPRLRDLLQKHDSRVLELGAGSGYVGLACAISADTSPGIVTITELDDLLDRIRSNAKENKLEGKVNVCAFDWREPEKAEGILSPWVQRSDTPDDYGKQYDIVLASDCLYEGYSLPTLMQALLHVCSKRTRIILSYRRRHPIEQECFKLLGQVFDIWACGQAALPLDMQNIDMWVLQLVRKRDPEEDPQGVKAEDESVLKTARGLFKESGWLLER